MHCKVTEHRHKIREIVFILLSSWYLPCTVLAALPGAELRVSYSAVVTRAPLPPRPSVFAKKGITAPNNYLSTIIYCADAQNWEVHIATQRARRAKETRAELQTPGIEIREKQYGQGK